MAFNIKAFVTSGFDQSQAKMKDWVLRNFRAENMDHMADAVHRWNEMSKSDDAWEQMAGFFALHGLLAILHDLKLDAEGPANG
jgi:ferric-dicitrate binding protein FerR (iron transport regulator)